MAHVNQEKKAAIAAALKLVLPKSWKYSLRVRHHMTIVLTVYSAPIDIKSAFETDADYYDVNPYWYEKHCKDDSIRETLINIFGALNTDNWNRSDYTTDYFDVGHYVDLQFGRWDKPFVNTSPEAVIVQRSGIPANNIEFVSVGEAA